MCYALKGQQDGARSISVVVGPEGFEKKKTDLEVLIERTKRLPWRIDMRSASDEADFSSRPFWPDWHILLKRRVALCTKDVFICAKYYSDTKFRRQFRRHWTLGRRYDMLKTSMGFMCISSLSGTECKRLQEFFQHFYPKCKIIWGSPLFWSTFKPTTKINFFALKPAVQSHFTGKWLGLEQIFISQTPFRIWF